MINNRVSKAENELRYSRFSDFTVINDDYNLALSSLKSLILYKKINQNTDLNRLNRHFESC